VIFLLYFVALVLFALAAFGVASRINLLAAGLACWVTTHVIATWPF
jgi:hypothetical protein